MEKIKKYIPLVVWVLMISAVITTFAFTTVNQQNQVCNKVEINIIETGSYFLENVDVLEMINDKISKPVGKHLNEINTAVLENCLNANPFVADAQVFLTVDGIMQVNLKQRNPILRVMNQSGESFYIDEAGYKMPVSEKYAASVITANGFINDKYLAEKIIARQFEIKDTLIKPSTIEQLYSIALYLNSDTVLNSIIEQIYIAENGEVEMIPRIGDQVILIGNINDLDEKMQKLLIFYRKGLNKIGWTNYSVINLKYKNQVVVSKTKLKQNLQVEIPLMDKDTSVVKHEIL